MQNHKEWDESEVKKEIFAQLKICADQDKHLEILELLNFLKTKFEKKVSISQYTRS